MGTTVTCPSCDASWHADTARFCGDCGGPLQAPPREPAPPRPWVRVGLGLVLGVALVGGAFAVAGNGFRLPERGADPVVDLEPDDLALEGAPLSEAERAEALAPFDPDRLRCEPEGCERWRVDFARSSAGRVGATVLDDLVIATFGGEVLGFALDSGQEQWRTAWPGSADPPPRSTAWVTVAPAVDDLVVVAWPESGHLLAVTVDGRPRWHATEGHGQGGFVAPDGDIVLVARPSDEQFEFEDGEGGTSVFVPNDLRVLDATSGSLLWEAGPLVVHGRLDDALLAHDGTDVLLLDARTGEELARRRLPMSGWFMSTRDVRDVLVHDDGSGRLTLLAADTLEHVADLGPLDAVTPTEDGAVLVGRAPDTEGGGDRILRLETDGTVRWEHVVPGTPGALPCCERPFVDDGELVFPPLAGTDTPYRLRVADGTRVVTGPAAPGSAPAPSDEPNTWWAGPNTAISFDVDGAGASLVWHDGYRMGISGSFSGLHTTEPPLVLTGDDAILAIQPVPGD